MVVGREGVIVLEGTISEAGGLAAFTPKLQVSRIVLGSVDGWDRGRKSESS